jgi:hypothetical protein
MTNRNLLPAALIVVAMIAAPAMARTSHVTSRHHARDVNARTSPTASNVRDRVGISAPGVSAMPPPPDGNNCDVGDNPRVC